MNWVDSSSFEQVEVFWSPAIFSKDDNLAYIWCDIIENSHWATFEYIWDKTNKSYWWLSHYERFFKDKNHVYYYSKSDGNISIVDYADPDTFELFKSHSYPTPYQKDKNTVYYLGEKMDVDVPSFEYLTIWWWISYAKDENNIYGDSKILDFDASTFEFMWFWYLKDDSKITFVNNLTEESKTVIEWDVNDFFIVVPIRENWRSWHFSTYLTNGSDVYYYKFGNWGLIQWHTYEQIKDFSYEELQPIFDQFSENPWNDTLWDRDLNSLVVSWPSILANDPLLMAQQDDFKMNDETRELIEKAREEKKSYSVSKDWVVTIFEHEDKLNESIASYFANNARLRFYKWKIDPIFLDKLKESLSWIRREIGLKIVKVKNPPLLSDQDIEKLNTYLDSLELIFVEDGKLIIPENANIVSDSLKYDLTADKLDFLNDIITLYPNLNDWEMDIIVWAINDDDFFDIYNWKVIVSEQQQIFMDLDEYRLKFLDIEPKVKNEEISLPKKLPQTWADISSIYSGR